MPLDRSLGRVLAQRIAADRELPPFDKSLVDGFAVRSIDLARGWQRFRIVAELMAGDEATTGAPLGPGEAVRVMTGAPIPAGADAVEMIERVEELSGVEVVLRSSLEEGANRLRRGTETQPGQVVLEAGRLLGPAEIGVLATFGRAEVEVYERPRLAVISTGSELVRFDQPVAGVKVRDSNGPMVAAQARRLGLEVTTPVLVGDDPTRIREELARQSRCGIVVLTGGVSMGDRDYVEEVLTGAGYEIVFHRVAIKPGKPVLMARSGDQLVFGLPGNPVSAFVTFELFVRTAVRFRQGLLSGLREGWATLQDEVRQKPGRLFFKPGRLKAVDRKWAVVPLSTVGSADLTAFAGCNCLIMVPAEVSRLHAGATVRILLLEGIHDGEETDVLSSG